MNDIKELKKEALKEVVGKSFEEAERIFKEKYSGFVIRCVWRDGQSLPVTKNLNNSRLNVGVQDGVVVDRYGYYTAADGNRYCQDAMWC